MALGVCLLFFGWSIGIDERGWIGGRQLQFHGCTGGEKDSRRLVREYQPPGGGLQQAIDRGTGRATVENHDRQVALKSILPAGISRGHIGQNFVVQFERFLRADLEPGVHEDFALGPIVIDVDFGVPNVGYEGPFGKARLPGKFRRHMNEPVWRLTESERLILFADLIPKPRDHRQTQTRQQRDHPAWTGSRTGLRIGLDRI